MLGGNDDIYCISDLRACACMCMYVVCVHVCACVANSFVHDLLEDKG